MRPSAINIHNFENCKLEDKLNVRRLVKNTDAAKKGDSDTSSELRLPLNVNVGTNSSDRFAKSLSTSFKLADLNVLNQLPPKHKPSDTF